MSFFGELAACGSWGAGSEVGLGFGCWWEQSVAPLSAEVKLLGFNIRCKV